LVPHTYPSLTSIYTLSLHDALPILQFAATYPDLLQRLVIVDSMIPLAAIDQIREIPRVGRAAPYPDYATIVSRYRLLPEQPAPRSEEHTSELQSRENLVCRLLLEKK